MKGPIKERLQGWREGRTEDGRGQQRKETRGTEKRMMGKKKKRRNKRHISNIFEFISNRSKGPSQDFKH